MLVGLKNYNSVMVDFCLTILERKKNKISRARKGQKFPAVKIVAGFSQNLTSFLST
jgi:hypothetical protein